MMRVLFINPSPVRCGVHQYGKRLCSILELSRKLTVDYWDCPSEIKIGELYGYDVIIYNVHPGISNAISAAPFPVSVKQVGIFHDGQPGLSFDAWWFSDSSAPGYGNLRTIGRPLPDWKPSDHVSKGDGTVTIGLSGLVGAWATTMVEHVRSQLPEAAIRLHLAASDHCDPSGGLARAIGERCQQIGGAGVAVEYDFKTERQLLLWLEANDLNCYIRTPAACNGISSALDMALAVNRPIAINDHHMFRHLARVSPEICIENSSLLDIMALGMNPLIKHQMRNDRHFVCGELEVALEALFLSNQ